MARIQLSPPLMPKDGSTLRVIDIERISTEHQDERSLADQRALLVRFVEDRFDGPIEWTTISSRGSGELLDRQELRQLEESIETGSFDLVVAEDLGRICRRNRAIDICEMCEDSNSRLMTVNDGLDTGLDNWRLLAGFASLRHETYNADTSKRIRRSLRNRFLQGGVFQCVIFGYLKSVGSKSDDGVCKDPAAAPIYDEWFRRLEDGASFSEIADWLNQQGIPTGKYIRGDRWTLSMVGRITRNPILKGLRERNRKMSKRVNKTGRHQSVSAPPSELLQRHCPHLAFIDPDRYDRVIRLLADRHAKFRRRPVNGVDSRKGVPKKRTRWPGQSVTCGICGRIFLWGGNGQTDHLMCGGARDNRCWNGISFDGVAAARKLSNAVFSAIASLPEFDADFLELLRGEIDLLNNSQDKIARELQSKERGLTSEIANVMDAICKMPASTSLLEKLAELEANVSCIRTQLTDLTKSPRSAITIPSIDEIKCIAREKFATLALGSREFGRLMRQLAPQICVLPVRLLDGGHPVLRATVRLDLACLLPGASRFPQIQSYLETELTVDLFDAPQRVVHRDEIMQLTDNDERLTERDIAARLGITQPVVQRAKALQRLMAREGVSDPYRALLAPPDDYAKLRRHLHPRYRFEPLPGFPRRS